MITTYIARAKTLNTMSVQKIQKTGDDRYVLKSTLIRKERWKGISSMTSSGILAISPKKHIGNIEVIDIENRRKKKRNIKTGLWLDKLKITPDGKKVVVLDYHRRITIWGVQEQRLLLQLGHGDNLLECVFSKDSKRFFQRSNGSSIESISLENGSQLMISDLSSYGMTMDESDALDPTVKFVLVMMREHGQNSIICMALSVDDKVMITC